MNDRSSTVALVRCPSYEGEKVQEAVRRTVDLLGGMDRYVRPGERVLLKPNLLKASRPEAAVTTHPEVVRSVIRLVRECGASPVIGDSPGIGDLRRVCERAGILAVMDEEGVPLIEFDAPVPVKSRGRFQRIEIAQPVVEADAIINLPKFKTHGMTTLTGAVKNLFGCIPGKRKVQWHFSTGIDHDAFMRMLVELMVLLKPRLTIMDAIVGMEGNGPGSGDPREIGVVLAGKDPVAVDAVMGALVGIGPERLPVLRAALSAGVGEPRIERIETLGEKIDMVSLRRFRLPPQAQVEWRLPEWAQRALKDALTTRPEIDNDTCVRCGICWSDCPQKAIAHADAGLAIDHRACIRCFCCQEFCPQGAITVGTGWLLKLIGR